MLLTEIFLFYASFLFGHWRVEVHMFSFPEKVVFRETEVGKKLELLFYVCGGM